MNKTELFEKIPGDTPPTEAGTYLTNFGTLRFDGSNFLMNGHQRPTATCVEWWAKEYVAPGPVLKQP
jgi:hypothetical protein